MNSKNILQIAMLIFLSMGIQACGDKKKDAKKETPDVLVTVQKVQVVNQPELLSFTGKLEAETHSNISTRIMGQIAQYRVEPGQKVKKGDLLVQIKDDDIRAKKAEVQANLLKAKAAFDNAKKDFERFTVLFEQKSASQKELDDVTTHYNMAKAQLEAVKQMEVEVNETLKYSSIRAPYSGVVTRKYMNNGDMASPGMPLVAMEKPGTYKVMARIPETEISKLNKNDKVQVKISALNNLIIDGVITEINPSALYTGNQFEAKVVLTGATNEKLYSGMYAQVLLKKDGMPGILVPKKVLVKKGQLTGIYTRSNSETAILRWVRTGKEMGDQIEILSGLNAGEQYIVSYQGKIWNGAKIKLQ